MRTARVVTVIIVLASSAIAVAFFYFVKPWRWLEEGRIPTTTTLEGSSNPDRWHSEESGTSPCPPGRFDRVVKIISKGEEDFISKFYRVEPKDDKFIILEWAPEGWDCIESSGTIQPKGQWQWRVWDTEATRFETAESAQGRLYKYLHEQSIARFYRQGGKIPSPTTKPVEIYPVGVGDIIVKANPSTTKYHPKLPPGYKLFRNGLGEYYVKRWESSWVGSAWYRVTDHHTSASKAINEILDAIKKKRLEGQETEVTE